jgi:ubiquinone/menaquinone biosynthesis C-methylase UbiE|tara:strand:+ start:4585 stop:5217 length:633 start_codon:yes stop_codon:yes gene_type:complete
LVNEFDRYRHEHDKGVRAKISWLLKLPKFWNSPLSKEVIRSIDPQKGENVLDIGAGMGPASVEAASRGAHVVAIDPSRFMRAILGFRRQFQKDPGLITVEAGAAEKIPLSKRSTDVVCAVNAIHHWTDLEGSIEEIARVIAPGGRVLLVDEDFTDPEHPQHETHHDHEEEMTKVDVEIIKSLFEIRGFEAKGKKVLLSGLPVKLVEANFQ